MNEHANDLLYPTVVKQLNAKTVTLQHPSRLMDAYMYVVLPLFASRIQQLGDLNSFQRGQHQPHTAMVGACSLVSAGGIAGRHVGSGGTLQPAGWSVEWSVVRLMMVEHL